MLSIGIVGLPNTGKSTLFNALVKARQAKVAEHPFTTIKPNVGVVEVPDETLSLVASRLSLAKKIPATIEFVDIAGLVKDAHKGEGLGNQFLSHIRECDAILHLIRLFDEGVPAPNSVLDPESDLETIKTELVLKDLETVLKALKDKECNSKTVLEKIMTVIGQDKPASKAKLSEGEKTIIKDLNLLTLKPVLYLANVTEKQIELPLPDYLPKEALTICAKTEAELNELDEKDQREYLKSLGQNQSGLDKIIQSAYKLLDLITFYTLLPNQIQAWSIKKDATALEAAGKIHTDFVEKFIAAEVINAQKLIKYKSWQETHQKGEIKTKGKNSLIFNHDVIYFKHG